jgi:hypothetical protein
MSRWTILPVFLIGLPLIACTQAPPSAPGTKPVAQLGPMPVGAQMPLVTVDQAEIANGRESSAADTIVHSSAWPIVTVTGPRAQ